MESKKPKKEREWERERIKRQSERDENLDKEKHTDKQKHLSKDVYTIRRRIQTKKKVKEIHTDTEKEE